MKKIVLLGYLLLNVFLVVGQQYKVKKEKGRIYILHTVEVKETLFSLGRLYNLSHKDIASANKLDAAAGLKVGQQLKIPLGKSNFIQTGKKQGYEPVDHTIGKVESLYKLSQQFNKVKEAQLKKWNKLSKNIVKPGQNVIVGYVKITEPKADEKATMAANSSKQKSDTPVTYTPAQEKKTETIQPVQQENETDDMNVFTGNSEDPEGAFAEQFAVSNAAAQPKTLTGSAATFKSISGWSDRKYYILVNDIPVGTIVKVNANNKTIYAKVLESLPSLRDNKDLTCRLSNAAASALGITEPKFQVELYYTE